MLAIRQPLSVLALFCLAILPLELARRPAAGAAQPGHAVGGLIGEKYQQLRGAAGPLGHPTSDEMDAKEGKGRYQNFDHGVIGWTPLTGPKSMQAAYVQNQQLVFEWGDTSPFNYDFFLVRWDLDGKNIGQQEIKGSRTGGHWSIHLGTAGRYRIVVEGGDGNFPGSSKFRQGWSNPLYIDFVPPGPDYSYTPPAKQPLPAGRKVVAHMPQGLYLQEWMRQGGPDGPMGLPKTDVQPHRGGGKGGVVTFDNGQIAFSPDVWENGILAGYQSGDSITVDWLVSWDEPNPPSHFSYDKFIVRWDFNGKHVSDGDQVDVKEKDDTHLRCRGSYGLKANHGPGDYTILVEGADEHTLGHSTARQGWMHPVTVHFSAKDPGLDQFTSNVSLHGLHPAQSVQDAKANFDRRAAAAILANACQPLEHTMYKHEEGYATSILAMMAYPDYFQSEYLPGRDYKVRDEVIKSLRRQECGSKAGTDSSLPKRTGDYDVAMMGLVAVLYKYHHLLPPDVQDHVLGLLNKRGPLDGGDLSPYSALPIPETENHINMIETSRYLANQLLYIREGDPKYDNARNGMDDWWLQRLQHFLMHDFIEYNARPYQDYTMSALLNLYTFTSPHNPSSARVKLATQMVLDYLAAKYAVSSNDSRRSATYRRHAEGYNDPDFLGGRMDPWNCFSMQYAGTTEMGGSGGVLPGNFAWEMQWGSLSDYRVPDSILDLMIERHHRVFSQRFHHYADEAYASSLSYLIASGGHYATFAYKAAGITGKHDDIGLAVPTTFMPSGQLTTRDNMIRFEGVKDDDKRSNMGVAPDFACGINLVIPAVYQPAAVGVDDHGQHKAGNLKTEPWTFIDQSTGQIGRYYTAPPPGGIAHNMRGATSDKPLHMSAHDARAGEANAPAGPSPYGYYVAIYHRGGFGFLEAYDTTLHPGLSFNSFMEKVLGQNSKPFNNTGRNTYTMVDGRKVEFEISPDSQVFQPAEKPFFVHGTILNSGLNTGYITIDNPSLHKHIILDMRDWKAPKRVEN